MLKIGNRLRELRLEKGYSQEYLAHELNMTQGNYCKLESDHHFPSTEAVEKLASLYSLTPQELIIDNVQAHSSTNHDTTHSANGFVQAQHPQKLVDNLLSAQEKIIALQAKQIELLETKLRDLGSY